jgi:methyl-accepting chemotaxis protein
MVAGKRSSLSSLRGLSTAIAVTALVLVGSLLAASAFHLAWFGRVQSGMAQSPAESLAKTRALDEMRSRLGHGGVLQNLTLFAETGDTGARDAVMADLATATQALRAFQSLRLSPAESSLAGDLDRMLATYSRVLAGGTVTPEQLAGKAGLTLTIQHAAIADRIARSLHEEALAEQARLAEIAARGFWLGVAAIGALAACLMLLLWMVHGRVLSPLRNLAASVAATARGDWRAPVWGTDRADEFGDLSRAVDGFRRQAADIPDISLMEEDGRKRFKFEGGSADLFSSLADRLRDAGEAMVLRGAEMGALVAEVRRDLTGTVGEVKGLCTDIARTSADGAEKLGRSTEVLTRAAAQVQAFDANGPAGGLDALVLSLRSNADELADTLTVATQEVSFILKAVSASEGELRQVTSDTRGAANALAGVLEEAQEKLFATVRVLKASGETLSGTVTEAAGQLARAVDSVDAGEKALVAALGDASARLDSVTRASADRMDDAAAQVARSADLLETQAAGVGGQLHDALDEIREASTLLRRTTDTQADRLDPLADRVERLQEELGRIVTSVDGSAGEVARLVADFQVLGAEVRAEIDRRSLDPDVRGAAEEMFTRLGETLDTLGDKVQIVDEGARRLSQALAGGVDDATEHLRNATQDLKAQARGIAADAAAAAQALSRATEQQEDILAGMAEYTGLTAQLRTGLADTQELGEVLTAATEAVQALARMSDRGGSDEVAELRALVAAMKTRLDGLDGMAGGLTAAAETVRALMLAHDGERQAEAIAGQQALAALAVELKDRITGIDRLTALLEGAAGELRAAGAREAENRQGLTQMAGSLNARVDVLDGLSRQLTRAIDAVHALAERESGGTAAASAASRELSQRLAAVADQLRATATGLGHG